MNKEEIIETYMSEMNKKANDMSKNFIRMTVSDKKHMENGFNYAVTSTVEILNKILEKKENKFKEFVDRNILGNHTPTREEIDKEKLKIEMEKQKLELAKVKAQKAELASRSNSGPSSFGDFISRGLEHNSNILDKKDKKK